MAPLRLSPKHGVNPALMMCWWCQKEATGVALLGLMRGDAEAPREFFADYQPCEKCKGLMGQGVTLIEASSEPQQEGHMAIKEGAYPTGRFSTITVEAAKRFFKPETPIDMEPGGAGFLHPETYERLFGDCEEVPADDQG